MESSQTLLRLGHLRACRSHRCFSGSFSISIRDTTRPRCRHLLPVLLLPLPTILHLRNIRLLLDSKMANLPMERRMGLPRKILAVSGRILQHHPRTICQRRDHQRTIRTDDARPTTTQLRPIDSRMGLSSFPNLFKLLLPECFVPVLKLKFDLRSEPRLP